MKSKLNNATVMSIDSSHKVIELQKLTLRFKSNSNRSAIELTRSLDRTESEETQPIPAYDDPLY